MTIRRHRRHRLVAARGALLAGVGIFLTLAAGCSDRQSAPLVPSGPSIPNFTLAELRAAPEDLKFGGVVFTVDAELWRDFMPVSPPDGRPMVANVHATAVGEPAFPEEVTAAYLWVLNGDEVWGTKMDLDATIPQPPGARLYVARGGPKWGPGIDVEVAVGFQTTGGDIHLVRIPSVPIQRSD